MLQLVIFVIPLLCSFRKYLTDLISENISQSISKAFFSVVFQTIKESVLLLFEFYSAIPHGNKLFLIRTDFVLFIHRYSC